MSKFEDRLWRDLVRDHGSDLSRLPRPAARHARRARPRLLAGTTVGLAGVGTAVALALGAASTSPAFAVSRNHDGSVNVVITELAGIPGANRKLAQLGIRARAVTVAEGCEVPPPRALRLAGRGVILRRMSLHGVTPSELHAQLVPGKIPPGQTLVMAVAGSGHKLDWIRRQTLVRGAVPDCIGAPPPPPPLGGLVRCKAGAPPPGGTSGNSGNTGPPPPAFKRGNSGNSGAATPGTTMPQPLRAKGWSCQILRPPPAKGASARP